MEGLRDRNGYVVGVFLFALALILKLWLIASYSGGTDIFSDLEKTLMFLQGLNPYGVSAWKSPYPPFYFIVLAGVLLIGNGFNVVGNSTIPFDDPQLVSTLRYGALVFDLATGLLILVTLLHRKVKRTYALSSLALYLFVPSYNANLIYFHGDTFGYFLLALAFFFYVSKHYSLGSLFLGLSVIFKIHPILSIPLVAIWFYRNKIGFLKIATILGSVVFSGLVLPVMLIPYCYQVIIGYNASATPYYTFSLFNLFYSVLPIFYEASLSLSTINAIWVASTLVLFIVVSVVVWKRYDKLELIDVLVLGLVVWALPLRQVIHHYLLWFMIPLLMRGKPLESIIIVSIQEVSHSIVVKFYLDPFNWIYFTGWATRPLPSGVLIFFGVGILLAISEALILYFILGKPLPVKKPG